MLISESTFAYCSKTEMLLLCLTLNLFRQSVFRYNINLKQQVFTMLYILIDTVNDWTYLVCKSTNLIPVPQETRPLLL
jgi:hypothetical protein